VRYALALNSALCTAGVLFLFVSKARALTYYGWLVLLALVFGAVTNALAVRTYGKRPAPTLEADPSARSSS
jgi:hypothetical protein